MKRIIALLLSILLCSCTVISATAESSQPQFASTIQFVKELDANEVIYEYHGLTDAGKERITLDFDDNDNGISYTVTVLFAEDCEQIDMYAWNLLDYDPAKLGSVAYACNQCNYDWKYAKFYVDETDNTVTADMNLLVRTESAGDVGYEGLLLFIKVIRAAYPTLKPYAL